MKVRLLKKISRRFKWYKKRKYDSLWTLFDRKLIEECYCFETGIYYANEMLIKEILRRINRIDLYHKNRTKRSKNMVKSLKNYLRNKHAEK